MSCSQGTSIIGDSNFELKGVHTIIILRLQWTVRTAKIDRGEDIMKNL